MNFNKSMNIEINIHILTNKENDGGMDKYIYIYIYIYILWVGVLEYVWEESKLVIVEEIVVEL